MRLWPTRTALACQCDLGEHMTMGTGRCAPGGKVTIGESTRWESSIAVRPWLGRLERQPAAPCATVRISLSQAGSPPEADLCWPDRPPGGTGTPTYVHQLRRGSQSLHCRRLASREQGERDGEKSCRDARSSEALARHRHQGGSPMACCWGEALRATTTVPQRGRVSRMWTGPDRACQWLPTGCSRREGTLLD